MKRPLKNILSTISADVGSRALGFVATAYLAHVLGTASFGMMSVGLSVLSYVLVLSSPGLHTIGIRDVAAHSANLSERVNDIVSLRFALSIVLVCLCSLACLLFIESSMMRWLIIIFSCSAIPAALSLDWYFQGREQLVLVSSAKLLLYVVYVVIVLLLVSTPGNIIWTAIAFGAANLISSLFLLILFNRTAGGLRFRWDWKKSTRLLKESFPVGIFSILSQTILNLPVLIVGIILSASDVGLFSAAMKLVFFALMLDRVFYALFYPVISRYRQTTQEQFSHLAGLALKVICYISIPILVIGLMFAPEILSLVYGKLYADADTTLRVLLVYFLFTIVNTTLMCVLIAEKRDREFSRAMFFGTLLLVILCCILTYSSGIVGTAVGLSIGEGIMTLVFMRKVQRTVKLELSKIALPAVFAGVLMGVVILLLRGVIFLAVIPLALFLFLASISLSGGLSRNDLRFLRERFV